METIMSHSFSTSFSATDLDQGRAPSFTGAWYRRVAVFLRAHAVRLAQHRAEAALHQLDDRTLADIGLRRSEIRSAILFGRDDSMRHELFREQERTE
jgi:uncharacterized protein YjiS (DUF1127 family)